MTWPAAIVREHRFVLPAWVVRQRYSLPGMTGALLLGCASFTPSLLPRSWFWQGVVDGLSAVFGYAAAVTIAWLVRTVTRWQPPAVWVRRLWFALGGVAVPLVAYTLWLGQQWQRQVHLLTGTEPTPSRYSWIAVLALSVGVLLAFVWLARGIRRLDRGVRGWLAPRVSDLVAGPLSVVLVALLIFGVSDGVVLRGLTEFADVVSSGYNNGTNAGAVRPTSPDRSGSPASLVPWSTLGRQGRDFTGRGPTAAQLSAWNHAPARTPIRVYVGAQSASTNEQRAALAVRELRRTGAFDRKVLVVATTTGTGLVDPEAADALEYMWNGDTAIAAIQYSVLPSFVSLITDRQEAQQAGRVLFDQVYAAWSKLPRNHRPKLLVTAVSLGVFGSEAAFSGLADIEHRTDGVVWVGPPHVDGLHNQFVDHRDPGSPAWLPVYQHGRVVRFAGETGDLQRPRGPWHHPRVVYLQNGSDPVVVWTPRLLFREPDWLRGRRPEDVSPDMFWMPVVTFWQVTADLPSTYEVTPGHGHHYRELYADAWAAVAAPPGWTGHDTERLRELLAVLRY